MKKLAILLCLSSAVCLAAAAKTGRQPVDWVNPFIGTTGPGLRWMLFPGASMPFGMVKLSPDNREQNRRAGYDYGIGTISGFSHIHEWTMGGLLMIPTTGPLKVVRGPESGSAESFRSRYRHETEQASPGYYAVTLGDYNVRAELTSTTRAGFQRYTFPRNDQARILMALSLAGEYGLVLRDACIKKVSNTEIEGYSDHTVSGRTWQQYRLHFVVRFESLRYAPGL